MADATTLTPEEIQQLGEPIERIYASMTNELLINIGKHITRPTTTHTAAWEVQKLSEMGALTKENARIINKWIKDVPKIVRDTMEETRREALKRIEAEIERQSLPEAKTPPVAKATVTALEKYSNQLENETEADKYYTPSGAAWRVGEQLNLVHTTMLRSSVDKYANAIQQTVTKAQALEQANATQRILNQKTANVIIGKDTLQVAKRDAIRQIAKEGLAGFYDKAGRQWTPEAYVNMDIRTTVHNVAITAIQNDMVDHGVDVFQVSSHAAARPLCYPYQGKFFSWSVGDSGEVELGNGKVVKYDSIFNTTYGQPAGLFGINCGHYPIPIVPGVTIPHGADDIQSEEVNDKAYKESQVQRALERDIRAAKRDLEMLGDTATDEDRQRLKRAQEKMATFIADTGRSRRADREAVFMAKPGQVEAFKFPDTSPQAQFPREHSDIYREFTTGEQATEAFSKDYAKWDSKLTDKQRDAVGIYTSDGYTPINQMLRGEMTKEDVKAAGTAYTMTIEQAVKGLDDGIAKYNLGEPIRVYRGLDESMRAQLEAAVGGTYYDAAYMSTSVTPRGEPVIIQIDVPAGKGYGAWVDPLAQYGGDENEFLLARGTTLKINKQYVNAAGQIVFEGEYVNSTPEAIIYRQKAQAFTPATTIAEAEQYAQRFTDNTRFGALGVSYKGVDVNVANIVNKTVGEFYDTYNVEKFGGIQAPAGNTKLGQTIQSATAAYSYVRHSFLLNRKHMKTEKAALESIKADRAAVNKYLSEPDMFDLTKMRKVTRETLLNARVSGRSTVPETVQEILWHELGHSLEKPLKSVSNYDAIKTNMSTYAANVSGYATTEFSEYVAESFASYNKGEDKIDPELRKAFDVDLRRQ